MLRKLMKEKHISAKQLSEMTGIGLSSIKKYSSKERAVSVKNAKKIADVLNVEWWKLCE